MNELNRILNVYPKIAAQLSEKSFHMFSQKKRHVVKRVDTAPCLKIELMKTMSHIAAVWISAKDSASKNLNPF